MQRSTIINKLDRCLSEKIRSLGYCERCGKTYNLQCAHIISRKYVATRFDPNNLMCLCGGCHMWWHREPVLAGRWLEEKFPGRFDKVNSKRNSSLKYSTIELKEMYSSLQQPTSII